MEKDVDDDFEGLRGWMMNKRGGHAQKEGKTKFSVHRKEASKEEKKPRNEEG